MYIHEILHIKDDGVIKMTKISRDTGFYCHVQAFLWVLHGNMHRCNRKLVYFEDPL